ncbi:HAD-IB family hydrolase [Cellvibrio sp. UBA7671]|uniref:HAD family hydrolase n=1 Tax=Cellvibrio sp. UBA7671 TaxID=1946312 RepID=UPI002F350995
MFAFFDLDGTLIKEKSIISFYRFYLGLNEKSGAQLEESFLKELECKSSALASRSKLNEWFYNSYFSGLSRDLLAKYSMLWFKERADESFFNQSIVNEMGLRKNEGYEVVILTGSFYEVVKPIADFLNIGNIISAPLEDVSGTYTGRLVDLPTIGPGKVKAMHHFLKCNEGSLEKSYGYGDDISDFDYLSVVDNPIAFNGIELQRVANERGWKYIFE